MRAFRISFAFEKLEGLHRIYETSIITARMSYLSSTIAQRKPNGTAPPDLSEAVVDFDIKPILEACITFLNE